MIKWIRWSFSKAVELLVNIVSEEDRLSYSKINSYLSCPLKYKLENIYRMEKNPSPPLTYGSAIHNLLGELYAKYDIAKMTEEEVVGMLEKHWVGGKDGGFTSQQQEEDFKERARKLLRRFYKSNKDKPAQVAFLERFINGRAGSHVIVGRLDRVDQLPNGKYVIIDYKTGLRTLEPEAAEADLQANVYYLICSSAFPNKVESFYFYYLEYDRKLEVPYSPAQQKETVKIIDEVARKIRKRIFNPSRGPLCGWCDYYAICPAWESDKKKFKNYKMTLMRLAREEGRMGLSYSKMSMYQLCPREYRKVYLERRGLKPKYFFSIGLTVHQSLEEFFQYEGPRRQPTLEWLLQLYDKYWISKGWPSPKEEKAAYDEGKQWMRDYYAKYVEGQYLKAWAVEPYFELPLGNDHVMIGFLDRVEKRSDGYHIIDYKTDPKLRTQQEVDNDLQLTIYYWAIKEMFGITAKTLSLDFVRFNQRVTSTRTDKDIQVLADKVNATAGAMLQDQKTLTQVYVDTLRKRGVKLEVSPRMTIEDFQKCLAALNGLTLEGKDDPELRKMIIDESDRIMPPKINKYCAGCDFFTGCPLEEEIRSHPEKLMHTIDDKDANADPEAGDATKSEATT